MLKLDRQIPFVSEVFAFINDEVTAESCVKLLELYEQKWSISHIAPGLEVYVEDFTIKTKSPEKFVDVIDLPDNEQSWQQYVLKNYYGFLSDTHFVLDTSFYSDQYDVIFSNKYSLQATARAWGGMYAVWANQTVWLGRKTWKYVDFYANLAFKIEDFDVWAEATYKIVELKTKKTI